MMIDFETRYDVLTALTNQVVPSAFPTAPPECRFFLARGNYDPGLESIEARAEVRDFCAIESLLEDGVVEALGETLPRQISAFIARLTRVPAGELGLEPIPCTCSRECAEQPAAAILGPRSWCNEGFCDVNVEIDRTLVRPEGIEFVFAENADDPQFIVMNALATRTLAAFGGPALAELLGITFSCDPDRQPATGAGLPPQRVRILSVVDPAGL